MDADSEDRQRDLISRREKRWSMNSQRLEQIVAELMRPIGDLRRSFDTDLCALLEEYLTEAGLHAIEDDIPGTPGTPGTPVVVPNFAELALLLQQSANIYGKKVDLLYQHVLECSESLHTNTESHDTSHTEAESEAQSAATPSRRKRRASAAGWARIDLQPCDGARREADLRPPPTLPRMYIELEPRVLAPCDVPLLDYANEPVGLLQDFNVTWRLHGGLLVDELECGEEDTASLGLRAIPLSELQAAIAAAAPPSPPSPPPATPEPPDHMDHHPPCSTPIPTGTEEDTASLGLRAIPLSELQAAIAAAAPPSPPSPPPATPEPPDHMDHHPPCSTPIPTGTVPTGTEEDTASLGLRAIPLSELQAAIAAAAPPSPPSPPPATPEPPDHMDHHPPCSTPIPTEEPSAPTEAKKEACKELATPKQRKRKLDDPTLFQTLAGKIFLTPELRVYLTEEREFSLSGRMISRVVAMRAAKILAARASLREPAETTEFRGFNEVDKSVLVDIGGFLGFTATTESEATDFSLCLSRLASAAESDDDGFFEQSTFSGSEGCRPGHTPPPPPPPPPVPPPPPPVDYSAQPEWVSWRAGVVERAAAGEAKGLDVRALGASVLDALPGPEGGGGGVGPPVDFTTVLNAAAKDDGDVSRLFLATLFLANAGNVEIVQPPPLTLGAFSVRLASRDERRYCAAADADPAFLAR